MAEFEHDPALHEFVDKSKEYRRFDQSLHLTDHFGLPDGADEMYEDLAGADQLGRVVESEEELAERPHDDWERDWIERLRTGTWDDESSGYAGTNNFWNFFDADHMRELRMYIRGQQTLKRDCEEDGIPFEPRIDYLQGQLFSLVKSGLMRQAAERFEIKNMERLLENLAAIKTLRNRNGIDTARATCEELRRETARLLRELAVVMYDLGVPASVIFG